MSFITKWFWKRAVRHEMLSAAKMLSLLAGLLLIVAGFLGGSILLGLVLGVGVIIFGGRLKHRLWAAGFLIVGLVVFSIMGGIVAEGAAVLVVIAAALGLGSTVV